MRPWISDFEPTSPALCGFVEDRYGGLCGEPAGQRDLLLIAAGEGAGFGVNRVGLYPQSLHVSARQGVFGGAIDQAKGIHPAMVADRRQTRLARLMLAQMGMDITTPC